MTGSNCTLCGGSLTKKGHHSTPVCKDCGRVHHEDRKVEPENVISQQSNSEHQHESTNWIDSVEIADSTDEQLVNLLSHVDEVGSLLEAAGEERNRAAELIVDVWKHRLLEGRCVDVAVGACWYITFREEGGPRPIGVVADAVNVASSEIHSFRRTTTEELDLSLPIAQASEYLPYLRSQLDLSVATSKAAQELLKKACVSGDPAGIAAGGLYIAAHELNENVTMVEAAQTVDLSKETIWQRVDDLRNQ